MQIHSPQYSNPNRINLTSFASPTYRNKRIVSAELYSAQRVNSCKKLDSPSKALDKMRKKSQNNQQHLGHMSKPSEILAEMNNLKEQYTNLKIAYKKLVNQKVKQSNKDVSQNEQSEKSKKELEKFVRENDELKNKINFLQTEVERIKRESIKLIQIWEFRTKRLEENLAQKQKVINDLREYLKDNELQLPRPSCKKQPEINMKVQSSGKSKRDSLAAISESLIMGQFQTGSNMSAYVSISLNSILEQSSIFELKKQEIKPLQVSADIERSLNDITNRTVKQDQNKKTDENFKKFRKEINKKIEVNLDEKHKQFINNIQPKTPFDKKVNKSTKSSKIKLKKDDENYENKSSKKKVPSK